MNIFKSIKSSWQRVMSDIISVKSLRFCVSRDEWMINTILLL